jgi:glutamate-ammonia-ligase adenylyltransferase
MAGPKKADAFPEPLAFSRFARSLVSARPELQEELDRAATGQWTGKSMREFLGVQGVGGDAAVRRGLRRLRQRVLLRVLARDLGGLATLDEVCNTMSTLAEVALSAALGSLTAALEAEFGEPFAQGRRQQLLVVGMGKLGGGELNVSSDVDLVFVYPEEGETRGGRTLSNHEFFDRLGRSLVAALDEATDDGRVFRVDMRLRPWGDAGPLTTSFDALEQYLVTQGREWERYAWIKARTLCGARSEELAAIVRPFVYRKYLDYGAFAAVRDLHEQIRAEVTRREMGDHIKLGPGGIREIEFIAQAFQLIRGGRDPSLQLRPTIATIELLAQRGLVPTAAASELAAAYVFLRRLEHRLQYLDDAQTHRLPTADTDRELIARSMGTPSWRKMCDILEAHRERVSAHFEDIFSIRATPRHPLAPLWREAGRDEKQAQLAALGYPDPESAAARLDAVRAGSRYRGLPAASRERFDGLIPQVVQTAAQRPDPGVTLARCLDLLEVIARRAAYLALLDEHPEALGRLADLLGTSNWAADYLNRHPILLDELLDARVLFAPPDWHRFGQSLRSSLAELAGDAERQIDALREAHHAQVFRLLAQDLAGALTIERLADHLSDLADMMLQIVLESCWKQLPRRHAEAPLFAIVGYGKLGGKELGYASDLDIIFLHDDPHELAQEVYARLAQRLNHWLSARTAAGILFEIDLRLRPDGPSGLMVSSMEAFRRYQRESAWTWEHQALTRARFCAGDKGIGAAFEAERRAILRRQRDATTLRGEVIEMRDKLLESHPNRSDLFDLKHDRGGMIDIEFAVQFLVLAHAHQHPELVRNDGNIALLKLAAELALIPFEVAENARTAYREFRRRQHALRLNGARYARVAPAEVSDAIEATRSLWRHTFGAD